MAHKLFNMTVIGHSMAHDSEEKPSAEDDIANAKASVFDTLIKLRKWREEQLAECRMKQYLESEKSLQLPKENQKQFEQILKNRMKHQHSDTEDKRKREVSHISSISLPNDLCNYDTLPESSLTGHLPRCFDDSIQSNVSVDRNKVLHAPGNVQVFSELKNLQFSENNPEKKNPLAKKITTNYNIEPKRPFLKKGSGLQKYIPKSVNSYQLRNSKELSRKFTVSKDHHPHKTLKLKSALCKIDMPTEKVKHIRFDIGSNDDDIEAQKHDLTSLSKENENETDASIYKKNAEKHSIPVANTSLENNKSDISSRGSEILNLSGESKELEEFEMLENCAQNSSFNSDSSVVQRLLHGRSAKPSCLHGNCARFLSQNITSMRNDVDVNLPENPNYCVEVSLNKCHVEVQTRKQELQEVISDINPRIESLKKEILCNREKILNESDISNQFSTSVNLENRTPECDSNINSSVFEISSEIQTDRFLNHANKTMYPSDCTCTVNNDCKNFYSVQDCKYISCGQEECKTHDCYDEVVKNDLHFNEKSKINAKFLELQKEIERYKQLNARLLSMCKERHEIMRKLQKERDEFSKCKEAEMQELEAHVQEERHQIKQQKETFNLYQKLRKDNPTKKERDEINSLRLEVENLHEDLKREKIKYNNDSRKWKICLDNAERERDNFKLANIRLEEQCQYLLDTLKHTMKSNSKTFNNDCDIYTDRTGHIVVEKDATSLTEAKDSGLNIFQHSNKSSPDSTEVKESKSKTPSTSVSEFEKHNVDFIDKDLVDAHARDPPKSDNFYYEQNGLINKSVNRERNEEKSTMNDKLSTISVSSENGFKEINNGNSIERIYSSGEREIIYNNGIRIIYRADGKSKKFFLHNGTTSENFSDGKKICTYSDGMIITSFPDGLEITEYPFNIGILYSYPNGQKELRLPDGTVHNFLTDGSEEMHTRYANYFK